MASLPPTSHHHSSSEEENYSISDEAGRDAQRDTDFMRNVMNPPRRGGSLGAGRKIAFESSGDDEDSEEEDDIGADGDYEAPNDDADSINEDNSLDGRARKPKDNPSKKSSTRVTLKVPASMKKNVSPGKKTKQREQSKGMHSGGELLAG